MTCSIRGCKNERFDPWFVCYAHAEHLHMKRQRIEQGAIDYVEPPKPKRPPTRPEDIRWWQGYFKTVAKSA